VQDGTEMRRIESGEGPVECICCGDALVFSFFFCFVFFFVFSSIVMLSLILRRVSKFALLYVVM
jgi:hypothetical protein